MPNQDNPVLVQMYPQILRELDTILCHPLQRHGWCGRVSGRTIGPAGAALVPLHDGEVFLPGLPARRDRQGGAAGATVDEQENRVVSILAADLNPLLDATDDDKPSLLHPVG